MNERIMSLMSASLEAREGFQPAGLPEDLTPSHESLELHEYDVASVESVHITLGKIADSIEASLENQTLSESTLDMAKIAVESNADQLGVSLENLATFDGVDNATVTVESLGDTLKKIWDTIRTAIERAIKALRDFFAKLFGGIKKLSAYFDRLEKEVDKLEEDPKGQITVRSATNLYFSGTISPEDIRAGLEESESFGEIILGDYVEYIRGYFTEITKTSVDKSFIDAESEDDLKQDNVFFRIRNATEMKWFNAIQRLKGKGRIIGGYVFEHDRNGVRGDYWKLSRDEGVQGLNQSQEMDYPTIDEMKSMITAAKGVIKLIEKREDALKKIADARTGAIKSIDEFVKKSERGMLGAAWTRANARQVLTASNANVTQPVHQYINQMYSSVRAVGDLIEQTVKA